MTVHLGYEKDSNGMTDRHIKSRFEKIYNVEVFPDLISRVTNSVLEDAREWQNRTLEKTYPIIYLDALRVKGREMGKAVLKAFMWYWQSIALANGRWVITFNGNNHYNVLTSPMGSTGCHNEVLFLVMRRHSCLPSEATLNNKTVTTNYPRNSLQNKGQSLHPSLIPVMTNKTLFAK